METKQIEELMTEQMNMFKESEVFKANKYSQLSYDYIYTALGVYTAMQCVGFKMKIETPEQKRTFLVSACANAYQLIFAYNSMAINKFLAHFNASKEEYMKDMRFVGFVVNAFNSISCILPTSAEADLYCEYLAELHKDKKNRFSEKRYADSLSNVDKNLHILKDGDGELLSYKIFVSQGQGTPTLQAAIVRKSIGKTITDGLKLDIINDLKKRRVLRLSNDDIEDDEDNENENINPDSFYKVDEITQVFHDEIMDFLKKYDVVSLKKYLDKHVIGQEDAKRELCVSIVEHLNGILSGVSCKNNTLLIGPSGCGKSELLRTLKPILPIPIYEYDMAGYSMSGFTGDKKVASIIPNALRLESMNIKSLCRKKSYKKIFNSKTLSAFVKVRVEHGVFFLDEFDKFCTPCSSSSNDNVSMAMQGELLKIVEGANIEVVVSQTPISQERAIVDTTTMLFICAGAFSEMRKKEVQKTNIGFNSVEYVSQSSDEFTVDDIIGFGVSPELAGRIPVIATLKALSHQDMIDILKNITGGAMSEFVESMKGHGIEIVATDDFYEDVVNSAWKETGARALVGVLRKLKTKIMFDEMVSSGSVITLTSAEGYMCSDVVIDSTLPIAKEHASI